MALSSEFRMPGAFYDGGLPPAQTQTHTSTQTQTQSIFRRPAESSPPPPSYDHGSIKRKRRDVDTSTAPAFADAAMTDSVFSDSDFRRRLGTTKREHDDDSRSTQTTPRAGWGALAATALGGVVGRIWHFCRAGSFTGFHAGGGRGYDLEPSVDDISMLDSHMPGHFPPQGTQQLPGYQQQLLQQQQHDEYSGASSRESTPAPAPKRRQTTGPTGDDLGHNWVMVHGATPEPRPRALARPSPRNRNQAPSVTTGRRISTPARRPGTAGSGRMSLASTPTACTERPASSASFASARSTSPVKTPVAAPSPRRVHRASTGVATPTHHRRGSIRAAEGGNGESPATSAKGSPRLDDEAMRLAARRRREERNADVRMSAFSKTIQDMIRQGQEALATTVEVDGDGEGAWEDE